MKTKEPRNYRKEQFDRLEAKSSSQLEALLIFWEEAQIRREAYMNDPTSLGYGRAPILGKGTPIDQIAQIKAILASRIGRSKKRV